VTCVTFKYTYLVICGLIW